MTTTAIKKDGSLWYAVGGKPLGKIGLATDWATADAGGGHMVAVKSDGSLWAQGYNKHGQIGTGIAEEVTITFQRIGTDTDWMIIGAGDAHTIALKNDGTLWAWGRDAEGAGSGYGDDCTPTPTKVGTDSNWKAISAGGEHNLAVKADGTVWAWGNNDFGALGNGTTTGSYAPVLVNFTNDLFGDLNEDGIVTIDDLKIAAQAYGTSNSDADLNKDEIVDLYDLVILARKLN